jgi:hypothetical protein
MGPGRLCPGRFEQLNQRLSCRTPDVTAGILTRRIGHLPQIDRGVQRAKVLHSHGAAGAVGHRGMCAGCISLAPFSNAAVRLSGVREARLGVARVGLEVGGGASASLRDRSSAEQHGDTHHHTTRRRNAPLRTVDRTLPCCIRREQCDHPTLCRRSTVVLES